VFGKRDGTDPILLLFSEISEPFLWKPVLILLIGFKLLCLLSKPFRKTKTLRKIRFDGLRVVTFVNIASTIR